MCEEDSERRERFMIRHLMTKYEEGGALIVEAWLQVDFLMWSWCFSRRKFIVGSKTSVW